MSEHTKEELFDLLKEYDLCSFNIGEYEGDTMLIVDSWEDLTSLHAHINGYKGNLDLAVLFNFEDLNKEFNEAIEELNKTRLNNPEHLGTISRLERKIKQLSNLSAYKRWVFQNEIEELDFDDFGVEVGFSDEYDMCCHCGNNIVRTSPDSYCWTAPLFLEAEGYVCSDCASNYNDYVLGEYKNEAKSIPEDFNPSDLGLVKVNDDSFQNGLHEGMADEPKPIIEALNKEDIDVWFVVSPSQFYCDFDVYVESKNLKRARKILSNTNVEAEVSPATLCKQALQAASAAMSELPEGQGIKYAKINSDGTANVRLVSKDEFIKGIKD
jgi:hypothetical protein